jgi:hypothetical protein
VQQAGADDTVFFHYSGHGSQVEDLNGDERDDGLDETIVPQDGRSGKIADITDDELDALFARLRTRNAIVVLDSCHSGTATRAVDIRTRSVPRDTRVELYQPATQTRAIVPLTSSRYVVMSAAASDQEALDGPVDGRYHGFFTYALAKSLSSSRADASPRDLFGGVARELNRIQARYGRMSMPEPQLEAPTALLDQPLVQTAQAARTEAPRLAWLEANPAAAGQVVLTRGLLLGAAPGSTWTLYAPGETNFVPGHALAVATVTKLNGADALARAEPANRTIAPSSRAVALMPAPASGRVAIGLLNVPPERRKEIEQTLSRDIVNVSLVGPPSPAQFLVDFQGDNARLLTADGLQVVGTFGANGAPLGPALTQAVSRLANASELLALDNPSSQVRLYARVANTPAPQGARGIAVVADTQPAQLRIRRPNDPRLPQNSLQLEVSVDSDAYITIVDVDSEGGVNLLFPNDYQQRTFYADGFVRARERVLVPDSLQPGNRAGFYWDYSPPSGIDTVRVFASSDLATATLIRQRIRAIREGAGGGFATRSVEQNLDGLREDLVGMATRGITVVPASGVSPSGGAPSDWAATSLTVRIAD